MVSIRRFNSAITQVPDCRSSVTAKEGALARCTMLLRQHNVDNSDGVIVDKHASLVRRVTVGTIKRKLAREWHRHVEVVPGNSIQQKLERARKSALRTSYALFLSLTGVAYCLQQAFGKGVTHPLGLGASLFFSIVLPTTIQRQRQNEQVLQNWQNALEQYPEQVPDPIAANI